jgi:hypothetical protein
MKTILITCLLGVAMLFGNTATAEKAKKPFRIVDVNVQQDILLASSDAQTGGITKVEVLNANRELELAQQCGGGYSCEVDISGLHSGSYIAKVTTTLTTYTEGFTVP